MIRTEGSNGTKIKLPLEPRKSEESRVGLALLFVIVSSSVVFTGLVLWAQGCFG